MSEQEPVPLLRVVSGDPTAEELAALVVVLVGSARPGDHPDPERFSRWADRGSLVRRALPSGPGAWRAYSRPR